MVAIKGSAAGLGTSNTVFNVDGPITYKDIYSVSEGKWKTVLVGGLGYGGKSYYALDITDPDKPQHLFTIQNDATNKVVIYWDAQGNKTSYPYASAPSNINYSTLGDAWSRPVLMLLPYSQGSIQQKWVAVFGGGYAGGTTSGTGAQVFILDMDSNSGASPASSGGQILTNIPVPSDPASSNNIVNAVPSHLTVVTSDGTTLANYYGGIGYFTDLQGQLWKLNLSKKSLSDANSTSMGLIRAFKTEATQLNDRYAFNMLGTTVVQGTVTGSTSTVNRVYNYFGTGDITHLQRRNASINNRIYGVQDPDFPSAGLTSTNLTVSSTSFTNVNTNTCSVKNSWYADVWAKTGTTAADDNQKIIGRAAIYNKNVYFTAYKPGLSCGTGTSTLIEYTDSCIATLMGAPSSGLATAPVIDNKGNIYVGLSNVPVKSGVISSIVKTKSNAAKSSSQMQYRSWREKRN
jgi:type IV pilus assembly protein PilY1